MLVSLETFHFWADSSFVSSTFLHPASLVDSPHAPPLHQLHPRGRQPYPDGLLHRQSPFQLQGNYHMVHDVAPCFKNEIQTVFKNETKTVFKNETQTDKLKRNYSSFSTKFSLV